LEKFGKVYAVDINDTALLYAKKKGIKNLYKASVENLPFKNDFFDMVVCSDVLYHKKVTDDEKALKELHRVLKPDGLLFLRLPAFEFLRGAHDIIVQTRHRYTAKEIKEKLVSCGFAINKLTYANMILSIPLFVKRSFERFFNHRLHKSDTTMLPDILNEIFYH